MLRNIYFNKIYFKCTCFCNVTCHANELVQKHYVACDTPEPGVSKFVAH
jgi:hypothetical protein